MEGLQMNKQPNLSSGTSMFKCIVELSGHQDLLLGLGPETAPGPPAGNRTSTRTKTAGWDEDLLLGPTYELGRLVGPLVDEGLEGLLHGVDEDLVASEAGVHHIVHLVLEVQQLLHHVLVLLRSPHDLPSKCLQEEKNKQKSPSGHNEEDIA